ncbi:MAG: DUF3800 domain-containing protein [Alphaproteobacteria bacterium]|nr:DUF3800 domain-containing protein [Alphaproteobacteria bacterium]
MAWFLFIDESGHDAGQAPYAVLAGVAIQDRDLWNRINAVHNAELQHFGRRYSAGTDELKGRKLLKRKVFLHAALGASIDEQDVRDLAKYALEHGEAADARHLKALAHAKQTYVRAILEICSNFRCRAFASIVETDARPTASDGLRKDYAYLFERFFYFLEDQPQAEFGVVVFDELEKSKSHILIEQTQRYFRDSATGRHRASRIIPEPFFVHSDLTTGIQLADIVAYCLSWAFRLPRMTKPARTELSAYVGQIERLRYRAVRERQGRPDFVIWSFAHITDSGPEWSATRAKTHNRKKAMQRRSATKPPFLI